MADIDEPEDVVDALDPGGIVERLVSSLMLVVAALLGVALTVVLVVSVVVLVALSAGLVAALATLVILTLLCLFLLILGVGVLLYFRGSSSSAQERIEEALARADDTPQADGSMTEEEAVTELKSEYAEGNIDDEELDRALDDALTSEQPERVVERYR
jgi:apolipoprotein N-acyltransferase